MFSLGLGAETRRGGLSEVFTLSWVNKLTMNYIYLTLSWVNTLTVNYIPRLTPDRIEVTGLH